MAKCPCLHSDFKCTVIRDEEKVQIEAGSAIVSPLSVGLHVVPPVHGLIAMTTGSPARKRLTYESEAERYEKLPRQLEALILKSAMFGPRNLTPDDGL